MAVRKTRVVVVGGSFAGLALALELPRAYDVVLLDPSRHLEILPNIHELVSGHKSAADLRLDRARLLERAGHRHLHEPAVAIDPRRGVVRSASGAELGYDSLVVGVGSAATTHGVPGAKHAMLFRNVEHCAAIGRALERLADAGGRHPVVIVGGGLEGVEALGEILRRYREPARFEITLVEAGASLLPGAPVGLDREIRRRCAPYPVRILTGARVAEVGPDRVTLKSGEAVRSALTIWTGGIAPPALLAECDLAGPGAWAPVHATLESRRHPGVFVVGDAAGCDPPLQKQAYHALDMGRHAALSIARRAKGKPLLPFKPSGKPMLVSFGDLDTYLVAGETAFAGAALAPLKEAVYQLVMARFDRPTRAGALAGTLRRAGRGLREQLTASLGSVEALRRSLDLRVVR